MSRYRRSQGFTALRVEGALLPAEYLHEVAALQAPHQCGKDYGLSPSLMIKEEISRYWRIAKDLHANYLQQSSRHSLDFSHVGVVEWLVPYLRTIFGYNDLAPITEVTVGERVFKITHRACGSSVPLLLVTRDFDLDKAHSEFGVEGRRQAPHGLMQEYLNAEDASLWGMISNGLKLRILRDNASLTRPSYIEADLDLIFADELYSEFATLWLAAHASRLEPANEKPSSCIIETWRNKAQETGERALEELRDGVTKALRCFGNGFLQHSENTRLRNALEDGTLLPENYLQQLLRLIYRILFLITVEERKLLHSPDAIDEQKEIYASGYSLARMRVLSLRKRHYNRHHDLWLGLQVTFRALAHGEPGFGLPALGGLFQADQCPNLDNAKISNELLLKAIRALSYRVGTSLIRINYKDRGTEELGSVYESLLELQPDLRVDVHPWEFRFLGDDDDQTQKGTVRKLTGSYYTPPTLVGELIKSTIDPVIEQTVAENASDPRSAILNLKVLDPACGSGHFLLAAARRLAAEILKVESADLDIDGTEWQRALREVVQHCIFGVDRNPLAVELCRTALWIETVEPGKPLTFLDSHIQVGDSLIGILDPQIMADGIPTEAYKALTGDDKKTGHLRKPFRFARACDSKGQQHWRP